MALLLVLPACRRPTVAPPQPGPPGTDPTVTRITTLKEGGGRLDWSPRNVIAFDQLGADNYYDVFTMNPDGSNERCLTCGRSELPNRHTGNPAWHPSGDYIVFQAQKANAPANTISDFFANPGSGVNNDLWVMDSAASRFWRLTDVPLINGGVLHAHFSKQGNRLVWSERLSAQGGSTGEWALKVADFRLDGGTPRIENVRTFQPGSQRRFFESHGFSPDGRLVLFSGTLEPGQDEGGLDIYTLDVATGEVRNLTATLTQWDEHAQSSPGGGWIAWMSSMGPGGTPVGPRSDYWLMRSDGSAKRQISFFNQPGRPEHMPGGATAADSSWSPDGTKLLGYVILEFATGRARMVMIEFSAAVDALQPPLAEKPATTTQAVPVAITRDNPVALRDWDDAIERMVWDRQLALIATTADPLLPDRQHERFVQLHDGVPVHGGELVRQRAGATTVSVIGTLYQRVRVDTTPALNRAAVGERFGQLVGNQIGADAQIEGPIVLPGDAAKPDVLAFRARLVTADDILASFIDAHTGALVASHRDVQLAAPVRIRNAEARSRQTFDMRHNTSATLEVLSPTRSLAWLDAFEVPADTASDQAAGTAQAHTRTALAYLTERFGADLFAGRTFMNLIHPDEPRTTPRLQLFSKGPFYAGMGVLVFPDQTGAGDAGGALGSVARAVGRALIDATSRLIYRGESGALHEALAQIVADGTELFAGAPPAPRPPLDAAAARVLAVVNDVLTGSQMPSPRERAQLETVFLRAFTLMLPADSNLHQARLATLQSARDLYGSGTDLESRLARAWANSGVTE